MRDQVYIRRAESEEDLAIASELFGEYADSLPVDLEYQDFGAEVASLPGKYSPPRGALLLAFDGRSLALGCAGLRPLEAKGACEMKRLYLRPSARGLGIGRALAEAVVAQGQLIGYGEIRLDTLGSMTQAIALYREMGFERIPAYYDPVPPGTVFMALKLER